MPKNYKIKSGLYIGLQILKKSFLPFLIAVFVSLLYLVYSFNFKSILNENAARLLAQSFFVIFAAVVAFFLQRIAAAIYDWCAKRIAVRTKTKHDDEFIPLLKKVTNVIIWTIMCLIVLSNFGININALIATLGVSSLAIALAAQDTIANIIAGFLIMIDRPFRVGDDIKLPSGEKVKVLEIGTRRSRFLNSEDKSIIIMPNLDMSKSKVVNFTYGREKRSA